MTDYQKYINALRKCAKEHDNDRTSMGHIIVSDLCRDTANLLEALGQEPVLDKIRAEIMDFEEELFHRPNTDYSDYAAVRHCVEIIDKYKADIRGEE